MVTKRQLALLFKYWYFKIKSINEGYAHEHTRGMVWVQWYEFQSLSLWMSNFWIKRHQNVQSITHGFSYQKEYFWCMQNEHYEYYHSWQYKMYRHHHVINMIWV